MLILENWSFFFVALKTFIFFFLYIKLPFNVEWLSKVKPTTESLYQQKASPPKSTAPLQ